MSASLSESDATDPAVRLAELLRTVARRWKLVLCCVLVSTVLCVCYLRLATYRYTAELQVTPVDTSFDNNLISGLGGLGGLASLAGFDLSGMQGNSGFQLYVESMRSRNVADELAQRTDLMKMIFPREWNETTQQWQEPRGMLTSLVGLAKAALGMPDSRWHPPDGSRLQKYLERHLSIVQSTKRRVVAIEFDHPDPRFAVQFLTVLDSTVDGRVRQRTLLRANENIRYLTGKLDAIVNVDHRRALAQALTEQERLRMMASSSAPFAADPFGAPTVSDRPTKPSPVQVLVVAVVLGVLVGAAWAIFLPTWKPRIFPGARRKS